MVSCRNAFAALVHLRQVEDVGQRRAPSCQPRPADVGQRGARRRASRPCGHTSSGASTSSTRRSARSARSSSASIGPPRHHTSAGRLDRRSAATALLRKRGAQPGDEACAVDPGRRRGVLPFGDRDAASPGQSTRQPRPERVGGGLQTLAVPTDRPRLCPRVRRRGSGRLGHSVLQRRPSAAIIASASAGPHSPAS